MYLYNLYNKTGNEDDIIRQTLKFPAIARPWPIPAEFQLCCTTIAAAFHLSTVPHMAMSASTYLYQCSIPTWQMIGACPAPSIH